MRKKIFILIFLLYGSLFCLPLAAQAHILKTDGAISALLHINPDDDPVAGQPAEILFLITDAKEKFTPENCSCAASILEAGKPTFSSPLFRGKSSYKGTFAPAIAYTFPHKGIYTIQLTGAPTANNNFQSFRITYDIRVDKDSQNAKLPAARNLPFYLITVFALATIGYLIKKIIN